MDYRALLATHLERRASATIAVSRVPADQTRRFGMATLDREGRVTALVEKPDRADTPFASMGIYLFDVRVLAEMLQSHPVDMVLDVLRPMLQAGHPIAAHEYQGYWEDVGTVGSYYRANLELVAPAPRLVLDDLSWPILTRDEERPPVHVGRGAVIEDSLVANGCRVEGTVRRSVLSPGVCVEPGAEVVESVVMSDVTIGSGARVRHAILDKYAQIGSEAHLGVGEPPTHREHAWLEGLVLVGKDSQVPPGTEVERGSVVGVGSTAESFASNHVPAGTVLPSRSWHETVR
jgi:glucose-1-phosphate adenylyltransferase